MDARRLTLEPEIFNLQRQKIDAIRKNNFQSALMAQNSVDYTRTCTVVVYYYYYYVVVKLRSLVHNDTHSSSMWILSGSAIWEWITWVKNSGHGMMTA